jgi:competence protein ComGD
MKKEKGFTLLELLITLSILMIMLLLVAPISLSTLDAAEEERFFQTLEFDVLYIQSMAHERLSTTISFADDHYKIIRRAQEGGTIRRYYPKGITINSRISNEITFDYRGSVRNPRTIEVHTKNETYRMIFPFGKGRYYIEKE